MKRKNCGCRFLFYMSCLVLCKSSSEGEGQGNSLVLMLRSVVANDVKRILKRLKRQYKAWQCLPKNTRIFSREDQWVLLNGVCPAKDSRLPIGEHLLLPFCSWQKSQGLGNRHTCTQRYWEGFPNGVAQLGCIW